MERRLAGLLAIFMLMFFSACGQGDTTADKTPTEGAQASQEDSDDAITLTYYHWNPATDHLIQDMVEKFEQKHPHITIETQSYEPSDYWSKLSAMAASGNLPDVFDMSSGYVEEWTANGLLYNLQDFVERDLNMDDYYENLFDTFRYPDEDGDIYSVPYAWVTTVLYYNKDMFDEAGLDYPHEAWTWDDFLAAAKELTKDTNGDGQIDQWGFWVYGRYAQIEGWIYQNDGDILNDDKTRFEPDDNAIEALQFLTDLTTVHEVSPKPQATEGEEQGDLFPLQRVAMWVDGSFNIENIRDVSEGAFEFGINQIPRGPSWKEDVAYGWPDNIAIAKTTEYTEEAWEFIKFMIGEERTVEDYSGGKVPVYRATAESEAWLERDQQPANKEVILELGERIGPTSFTKNWSEWRGYGAAEGSGMNGELDQVFDGVKSLDEAIESMTQYANDVLERAYE